LQLLNQEQRQAYDDVMDSVINTKEKSSSCIVLEAVERPLFATPLQQLFMHKER